jgi:non-specific serine/threonine protein kinase
VAAARALCTSSLTLAREVGDPDRIGWSCLDLALVRVQDKNWAGARALFEESLRVRLHGGTREQHRIPLCLAGLARVAAAEGNPERAFRMFGHAAALLDATGGREVPWASCYPFDSAMVERWQTPARATLGEEAAAAAYAAGSALSLEEVLNEALATDEPPASARQVRAGGLTERQIEVVRLLATGMTNRDIAQALVVAPSTAERHVANILNKLGLRTRGQVAVWAVTYGVVPGPTASAT